MKPAIGQKCLDTFEDIDKSEKTRITRTVHHF